MASDSESVGSTESDKELQVAFAAGLLKSSGLNVAFQAPTKSINNVAGLKAILQELKADLPWVERLDLTNDPAPAPKALEELDQLQDDTNSVHNDFKREMKLQAQAAVLEGLPRLQSMGIPTRRPDDYMAEMAKSDVHMKKVREKLLSKQMSVERSEKAKKMRELRKYGKKVQQDVLAKRQKDKKDMMEQVRKVRKGKLANLDFLDDDGPRQNKQQDKGQPKGGKQLFQPNKKRQAKNLKFGFGGQKKRSKYNTAESAADMSGFSKRKHGSKPGKKGKGGGQQRPGKKRRQVAKNKKK